MRADSCGLESRVIEYCAPTLAGIKSANLFNYSFRCKAEVLKDLGMVNRKLNERGVYAEVVLWKESYALIYVYRKTHLAKDLAKSGVRELLLQYGYPETDTDACIQHLKKRLYRYDYFPHEIGVFLGYPLEDVIGFIRYGGKECKYSGLWKVYGDEGETKKLFEKLQKCTRVYLQVFEAGRSISQMTVSA